VRVVSDLERKLMELGDRVADTVHPSREMAGRVFRRAKIRRMVTSMTGALVAAALGVASFAAVATFTGSPSQDPVGLRPPAKSPTRTESPSVGGGQDIGLGFRVCRVSRLAGIDLLGDGPADVAWTATPVTKRGRCNRDSANSYLVAVDVTGDGMADASWGLLEWCFECRPFGATDFDADGDEELVVLTSGGSVSSYIALTVERAGGGSVELRPLVVAAPGDRAAKLPPGRPLPMLVGGDEGFAAAVACEGYPEDPTVVLAWSNHPVEGPGSETTEIHITRLALQDGAFHIIDRSNTEQPTDAPRPKELSRDSFACGLDLNPLS